MKIISFTAQPSNRDIEVRALDIHQEWLEGSINFHPQCNPFDHVAGSDIDAANILFIKNEKLAEVKNYLDKIILLQNDSEPEDYDPFHYMMFDCKGENYTIIIHNYHGGLDPYWDNYEEDNQKTLDNLEKAYELAVFVIIAGSDVGDESYFQIME